MIQILGRQTGSIEKNKKKADENYSPEKSPNTLVAYAARAEHRSNVAKLLSTFV